MEAVQGKPVVRHDFDAIRSIAAARKARRAEKAKNLWLRKSKPVKSLIKRGPLKAAIIRLLGLLDRKINGPLCRIGEACPQFQRTGHHYGTLAYHIVPAQRGDATRFVPENVVWACAAANYGEVMNRSLYREKHILVFGRERVERLESMAREVRQYKMSELLDLRSKLKQELEK